MCQLLGYGGRRHTEKYMKDLVLGLLGLIFLVMKLENKKERNKTTTDCEQCLKEINREG